MRKRNIQIITRLNRKEQEHLQALVKRSGLSQEAYIRHLINGVVPNDAPPADYYGMMQELHAIGNNLNQIARIANASKQIRSGELHEAQQLVKEAVRLVRESF